MNGVSRRSNRARDCAGVSVSLDALLAVKPGRGEQANRHDDRGDEEHQRSRHPHHDAGHDLIVERRETPEARNLIVDRIEDPPENVSVAAMTVF